ARKGRTSPSPATGSRSLATRAWQPCSVSKQTSITPAASAGRRFYLEAIHRSGPGGTMRNKLSTLPLTAGDSYTQSVVDHGPYPRRYDLSSPDRRNQNGAIMIERECEAGLGKAPEVIKVLI